MEPLDGIDLLFGSGGMQAMPVQDPVLRPQPVPRPGAGMPAQAQRPRPQQMQPQPAPQAPAPQAQPLDGVDLLFGTQTPQPAAPVQAAPADPMAEPDAATWLGRRKQDIMGKRDPRYANLPTIAEVTIREGINNPVGESAAWLAGTSDKGMANTYKDMLKDRYIGMKQDANGYPIVIYRGTDGSQQKAYVNQPGMDMQDVVRGGMGIAANVGAGRAIGGMTKGAALGWRALAQMWGQGATSLAQDAANTAMGGDEFDVRQTAVKAGLSGGFGAAGEFAGAAAGALMRKFVTEPGLFDKAAGRLTPKGAQAAKDAGLDPLQLSQELQQEFAKGMAATGNANMVANKITNREFGIPRTKGELTQDTGQLLKEQHIRSSNYGTGPAERLKALDEQQRQAIESAALGTITDGTGATRPGLAQQIAPGRTASDYGKAELGSSIRQNTDEALANAKAKEDFAWSFVPRDVTPETGALTSLRQKLNDKLGAFPVTKGGAAERMAQDLDAFLAGKAPEKAASWINYDPKGNIDQFRKRLSAHLSDAETQTEKRAAGAMYDAFNEWVKDAAGQGLLKGANPFDVGKMAVARGISREIHQVFEGEQGTAGARILADVLKKADSAEGVVNALFTGPTSQVKGGTMTALASLKKAYDTHLAPEAAKAAWDDIRLAYFLRMVQDKSGNVYGAQALQSNIKQTLGTQASVARMLYTPQELASMSRFAMSLQGIEKKNLNRSWSGVSAAGFARDFFSNMIAALGFNSKLAQTVGNVAGARAVKTGYGHALASDAMSGSLPRLPAPSFGGYGGAIGARSSED
jgi:hypothetical protein